MRSREEEEEKQSHRVAAHDAVANQQTPGRSPITRIPPPPHRDVLEGGGGGEAGYGPRQRRAEIY